MSNRSKEIKQHHRIATGLLIAGAVLITVAAVLNILFLKPANYKERLKQQQACLRIKSAGECDN